MSDRTLTVEFAFDIGEMVYCKAAAHRRDSFPRRFIILERLAQQCPGGVQLHYKLNGVDGNHLEIALTRDKPPYETRPPEMIAEEIALADAMSAAQTKRYRREKEKR